MASPLPSQSVATPGGASALPSIRPTLSLVPARSAHEPLLRALALDRLRDLRDDGVTLDYVGRMYGVSGDRVRQLEEELRRELSRNPDPEPGARFR
jgi:hypothetical protein